MTRFKVGDFVEHDNLDSCPLRIYKIDQFGFYREELSGYKNTVGWDWSNADRFTAINRPEDLYPGETVSCVDEKTGRVEEITLGGTKHDTGKHDLSLLPLPALEAMVRVLEYGANKYGRNNYKKGFTSDRLVSACMRHLLAWNEGEDLDPESGLSHIGHAAATLVMLLVIMDNGTMTDTRYKRPK